MLPDEKAVLAALFADSAVVPGHYLNVVHGDFVERTDLFKDAMAWNEQPLVPRAPEINSVSVGAGYLTVDFFDRSYGTDPITSYTMTATDDSTNPVGTQTVSVNGSPFTLNGVTNGHVYLITMTATNINGTSPPSALGEAVPGVPPKFVSGPAADAIVGKPYASGFAFTGAPPPTVRLLYANKPPPGLTLDSNGNLTGTPTTAGSYTFSVEARNALVDYPPYPPHPHATATITVSSGASASAENTR
jgi:hypothetical protein